MHNDRNNVNIGPGTPFVSQAQVSELLFLFGDATSIATDGVKKIGRELLTNQLTRLGFLLLIQHAPRSVFRQLFSICISFTRRPLHATGTGWLSRRLV